MSGVTNMATEYTVSVKNASRTFYFLFSSNCVFTQNRSYHNRLKCRRRRVNGIDGSVKKWLVGIICKPGIRCGIFSSRKNIRVKVRVRNHCKNFTRCRLKNNCCSYTLAKCFFYKFLNCSIYRKDKIFSALRRLKNRSIAQNSSVDINSAAFPSRLSLQKFIILLFNSGFSNNRIAAVTAVVHKIKFFTCNVTYVTDNMAHRTCFYIVSNRLVPP